MTQKACDSPMSHYSAFSLSFKSSLEIVEKEILLFSLLGRKRFIICYTTWFLTSPLSWNPKQIRRLPDSMDLPLGGNWIGTEYQKQQIKETMGNYFQNHDSSTLGRVGYFIWAESAYSEGIKMSSYVPHWQGRICTDTVWQHTPTNIPCFGNEALPSPLADLLALKWGKS